MAAGVASLVVALAINNGFRRDLQQRLLGSTSHISLQRVADDGIRDWPALMDRLSKQPHVVAAAPAIFEQVLISRGPRARGAVLKGMIPKYERQVGDLLNSVKEGSAEPLEEAGSPSARADEASAPTQAASTQGDESPDSLEGVHRRLAAMPPIVLGKEMADNVGAKVGSEVMVTSPQGELTPFGTGAEVHALPRGRNLPLWILRLRLKLGLRPSIGRATAVWPWQSNHRHRVQSRRS